MALMRLCPCCEQRAKQRLTPITDAEAEKGFYIMAAQGWTAERLLAERLDDIEYIAPGMADWLRRQRPASH